MDRKNNPFKVPENYFEELQQQLNVEAKRKHVSVSRVLKYVASISMILILSSSVFIIGFNNNKKEHLLSSNLFSIFVSSDENADKKTKTTNPKTEEIVWEQQIEKLVEESEEIQFTEEELDYLENFIDEDLNEYVFNNLEMLE